MNDLNTCSRCELGYYLTNNNTQCTPLSPGGPSLGLVPNSSSMDLYCSYPYGVNRYTMKC